MAVLQLTSEMSPISVFLGASFLSFLCSCSFYAFMAPHFHDSKQKAWITTFFTSLTMSLGSLPFLWKFILSGGDVCMLSGTDILARLMCGAFQGLLLSDLSIGVLRYPQHLTPTLGWTHHIVYALLLPYISSRGWSRLFSLCLSMEIPTCFLAISFLWPRLRHDILVAVVFFSTRIIMHATLLIALILPHGRADVADGSFIPATLLAVAFFLHISWFMRSFAGILRRTCISHQFWDNMWYYRVSRTQV